MIEIILNTTPRSARIPKHRGIPKSKFKSSDGLIVPGNISLSSNSLCIRASRAYLIGDRY